MGESFYHNSKRGFLKIKVIFFFHELDLWVFLN